MENFSIYSQLQKEIDDFRTKTIHIAGIQTGEGARYLSDQSKGYNFSQYHTLNLVDLYYNSKFETGNIDSEGQRKLFLNIGAFRADVASKMVDIDTKDFTFIADDEGSKWGTYLIAKNFRDWTRETYFGELINELVENYPKYGTVVTKRVGKKIERVPIRKLINQQDAKSLKEATHVIELHENMTLDDMEKYPDWDTSGIDMSFGETTTVYERYGYVPIEFYNRYKTVEGEAKRGQRNVYVVCICVLRKGSKDETTGNILFMEKAECPYEECHWKRQDGRWLGIGEIENLFENQISRNMIANLRRRALMWSSKKVFQSSDDTVARNLVRDVKDGDIIRVMPNGQITQVDMASREVGEFSSAEQMWENNSDQKSFTFEVATGEALPSGTPFRLGVVLSNAVASHFRFKKQKLGLFLKRVVVDDVFKIFKQQNSRRHTLTLFGDMTGIQDLKKAASEIHFNETVFDAFMSEGPMPDPIQLMQQVEESYSKASHLFIDIPDRFFDDIKHHMELTVTGEEIDTASKITTYTTLYQSLAQSGDPRAEQVLSKIGSLTGDNFEAVLGAKPQPQQAQPVSQQQPSRMPMPNAAPAEQL